MVFLVTEGTVVAVGECGDTRVPLFPTSHCYDECKWAMGFQSLVGHRAEAVHRIGVPATRP